MTSWRPTDARPFLLLALLLAMHAYFTNEFAPFPNPNVHSRVYLTLAILDHGTLAIDDCIARFGHVMDIAERDGRTYSDKAPGYSVLMVPLAWLLRRAGVAFDDLRGMVLGLRVLAVGIPCAAFWFLTRGHWTRSAGGARAGWAVLLAGALGTNYFIYATQVFSHATAGALLFCAYLVALRSPARHDPALQGSGNASLPWSTLHHPPTDAHAPGAVSDRSMAVRAAGIGLLLTSAFTVDYVLAPAIPVMAIWAVGRVPRGSRARAAAALLGAALPIVVLWMAYNISCFGGPLQLSYRHHAEPQYAPALRGGLLGIQSPDWAALPGMTLLPMHGILFMSPFLILAPLGWLRMWRNGQRGRAAAGAAVVLGIGVFITTMVDWRGGWSVSVRYWVPAIPFALDAVAVAVALPAFSRARRIFAVGAIVGIVHTALAACTFPDFPPGFIAPYYDLCLVLLGNGCVNGVFAGGSAGIEGVVPFFALAMLAAAWVVMNILPGLDPAARRARRRAWAMAVGCIALLSLLALTPGYHRSLAIADVMNKMGYSCKGDARALALHKDAVTRGGASAFDLIEWSRIRAASACADLRNPDEAVRAGEQAVSGAPGDPRAHEALATAYAAAERIPEAEQAWRKAIELAEGTGDAVKAAEFRRRHRLLEAGTSRSTTRPARTR